MNENEVGTVPMAKKVAIIGGTGFVGSACVEFFLDKEWKVTVIGRSQADEFSEYEFDLVVDANGSSSKILATRDPLKDFHAAVSPVFHYLRSLRTKCYVYCSSSAIYEKCVPEATDESKGINPANLTPYGFHRFLSEEVVKYYAPTWLILRLGGMVGTGLKKNPVYDLKHGDKIWVHEESLFQFMPTRFVAETAHTLFNNGIVNEIYNVGGDAAIKIREIAELLERKIKYNQPDPPLETNDVNLSKLKSIMPVPDSRKSVAEYLGVSDKRTAE